MNATKTYTRAADTAQTWAKDKAGDLEKAWESAEQTAQAASTWAADTSADAAARASIAAHKAGDWLERVSDTATDWLDEQSAKAVASLPAVAAQRARRRRWIVGSVILAAIIFYFFDPDKGRLRRSKVKGLVAKKPSGAPTTGTPSFSTQTVNEARTEELEARIRRD